MMEMNVYGFMNGHDHGHDTMTGSYTHVGAQNMQKGGQFSLSLD